MAERRKGGFIVNNSDSVCSSEGGSLVKWNVSIWQEQHFSALPSSVLEECMRRKRESDRWRIGKVLSEGTEGAYGSTMVLCCVKWNVFHHISPSLQSHSRAKQQPEHWLVLRRLFRHWTLRHGYKNVQKHFVLFFLQKTAEHSACFRMLLYPLVRIAIWFGFILHTIKQTTKQNNVVWAACRAENILVKHAQQYCDWKW